MRVGVIGTGHVGLVTCASLGEFGHDVVGTDQDEKKLALIGKGQTPFFEPGLEELLQANLRAGRLGFTHEAAEAIAGADAVFICVGTPPRAGGEANLVAVEQSARLVAKHATGDVVVVEKSTVPTGTAARLRRTLQHERTDLTGSLEIVSNPEFLREGRAVEDALKPERILVGTQADWALEVMRRLYSPLIEAGSRFIETDIATAELTKHACNAFLALKISYINAVARICERAGADIASVADVMGSDYRIGREFLSAGLGYGGSCFPKDLQAFERLAARLGYDFPLLREIERINREAVESAAEKVQEALWNLEDKQVTLWGLSFKPETDDVRFAPALELGRLLLRQGARVIGYDPVANANAELELPELTTARDPYEAARGSHCIVLCTEWDEFRSIDLNRLKSGMAYPVFIDGRNMFQSEAFSAAGFSYHPMGRAPAM